ncbi:hypothetical protein LshimejAT787_0805630 [Lyophyllum shimeji]|uniref:Uncharacterized protein n=1 Tax=Lyophyllum shimeji TaxID=47721 RepID=A0A9P3UPX0_LYOSH|nr:hypothetical protein LshimejAT787_0805630 [Lyophyllum shimeji]
MGHRVSLGEETKARVARKALVPRWISELVSFTFKYRPIDILRADGIAPLDPAQTQGNGGNGVKRKANEAANGDESEEDEEEEGSVQLSTILGKITAIQARQEKEQAELRALLEQVNTLRPKLAKKGSKPKTAKKIKTEPLNTKIKKDPCIAGPSLGSGEVIDLT